MNTQERAYSVLIADDVAGLRTLLRLVLEDSGRFRVIGETGDGIATVEAARKLQPDLVLLDISMPLLDGLKAMPRIAEVSPASCIVVVSGLADPHLSAEAIAKGAAAFIEKGLSPDLLVAQLLAALERR